MAESEKKKFGINIIDIAIILIFALALGVFGYYAMGKWEANKTDNAGKNILLYTVEIKDVPLEFATSFAVGDVVKDVRKGTNIGKIVSVQEPTNFRMITENKAEGIFEMSDIPDRYQTRLSIETSYKESDLGYFVDDVDLKVGKGITIKTEKIAVDCVILSVDKKGGQAS